MAILLKCISPCEVSLWRLSDNDPDGFHRQQIADYLERRCILVGQIFLIPLQNVKEIVQEIVYRINFLENQFEIVLFHSFLIWLSLLKCISPCEVSLWRLSDNDPDGFHRQQIADYLERRCILVGQIFLIPLQNVKEIVQEIVYRINFLENQFEIVLFHSFLIWLSYSNASRLVR